MNNSKQYQLHPFSFGKTVLFGATLGLALVSAFFTVIYFTTDGPLGLGAMIVLPLFTVSVGGAFGGVFFYLMDFVRQYGTVAKIVANITSALVYFAGLWLSLVIALAILGLWD